MPSDLAGPGLALLLRAFNHLLEQQQWARERLRVHAGRTLRFGLDPSMPAPLRPPSLALRVHDSGRLVAIDGAVPAPDVTLWLRPSLQLPFDALRSGPQGLARHLRIEGDVMMAGTLGELAQHLRWDAEDDLGRVIGDVAARRFAGFVREGGARLRDARARLESAAAHYVTAEQPHLVARAQRDAHAREMTSLAERIDALEARIARLSRPR